MIYKLFNEELNDTTVAFFLPDNVRRRLERALALQSMKERGYLVIGMMYVDKETYLNARLTETVNEYKLMTDQEKEIREAFARGENSYRTTLRSLEIVQERQWSLLKKINRQIDRIIEDELEVKNEIAIQLNDQYLKAIL